MIRPISRSATMTWAVLMGATAIAGCLAEDRQETRSATLVILALTAIKMLLILFEFMELKNAPFAWRSALVVWVAAMILIGALGGLSIALWPT